MSSGPGMAVVLAVALLGVAAALLVPRWWATRIGRRWGITSLGSQAPSAWHPVRSVVLDPMRTLTTGHLVVTEVAAVDPDHERNLRWFAGALAHGYDDPVGHAVAKLAGRGRLTNVTLEPGRGIRGSVDRHPVRVGQLDWIGLSADGVNSEVGTTVAVEVDQRPLGRITVAEEVRRDAAAQLTQLRELGMVPVLASPAPEDSVARLAKLAATPAWHSQTDPQRLAQELAIEGPVGLISAEPDGGARLDVVNSAETTPRDTTVIHAESAGIDTVVLALTLCHRLLLTRRRALWTAAVLTLCAVPLAVWNPLGILGLLGAAAAVVTAVLVAASWGFLDLAPADPYDAADQD